MLIEDELKFVSPEAGKKFEQKEKKRTQMEKKRGIVVGKELLK